MIIFKRQHKTKWIPTTGRFKSGSSHPRYKTDSALFAKLEKSPLGYLTLTGRMAKEPRRRYCEAVCSQCKELHWLEVYNVLSGKTTNCKCQRARKYPIGSPAGVLGQRYDAMIQRCCRWTHVSSKNYKGRGIKVEFLSREIFVKWALQKFPIKDFKGLDFDRIDNDGNYSPSNLRLVSRSVNLRNKSRKPMPVGQEPSPMRVRLRE